MKSSFLFAVFAAVLSDTGAVGSPAPPARSEPVHWTARWIWHPAGQGTVNFHFLARRSFELAEVPARARLNISAQTEYHLYLNGRLVGRGPTPCDPAWQSYDTYEVAPMLARGANVIAVACLNEGIGIHWQYAGPGGLICQLELPGTTIASDPSWRVRTADCYDLRSPRFFWSCGFAETFHAGRFDPAWNAVGTDDRDWIPAAVLPPAAARVFQRLIPRDIPFLEEKVEPPPVAVEKGAFSLQGVHAVHFDPIVSRDRDMLVYAQTWFLSDRDREVGLRLESDDAFRCYMNGRPVMCQEYNPDEARTKLWRGYDAFEQVHHGTTLGWYTLPAVRLNAGWNKVLVAVDHGPAGWGFCLAMVDPATDTVLDLPFAADRDGRREWQLAGPVPSSGFADSLAGTPADIGEVSTAAPPACPPFDYAGPVTDYSMLMHHERRERPVPEAVGRPLELRPGEYAIVDLGRVTVGFPRLDIDAGGGAVLDVGYGQVAFDDHRIRFSNNGSMKNVDRLYLTAGRRTWQPFQRRTGRFVHLSCRAGQVRLAGLEFRRVGYPVEEIARFECADPVLNRVWEVSRYTSRLLMHHGFQDCLKREQGTFNANQALYQYLAAAGCFGDHALVRKCLNAAIRTQQDDGWFHAHGPSSPNQDETTLCFYWLLLLREYYRQTGDLDYVREVFPRAEDMLRCFAKWTNGHGLLDGSFYVVSRPGQLFYLDDSQLEGPYVGHFFGELTGFNILYQDALAAAADLAGATGDRGAAGLYRARSAHVRDACARRLWDGAAGRYADYRKDERLSGTHHPVFQIAALHHQQADAAQRERILSYLVRDLGLPSADKPDYPLFTFGYYYYFLEVLFANGYETEAIELMHRYYGRWLELKTTTFGEHFRTAPTAPGPVSTSSMSRGQLDFEYEVHGYGTSAHPHFYQNLLGVRPAEPGFRKVLIAPRPGDLAWAKGRVSTVAGPVDVAWRQAGASFELDVHLPDGVAHEVRVPDRYREVRLTVNGQAVPAR